MKKMIEVMSNDIKSENFSQKEMFIYGFVVPVVLLAIIGFAGWLA